MAKNFGTAINLGKFELQNARIQNLASAPSSPVEGQIYHNSVDHNLYVYDGTGFVDLTVQGGGLSYGTPSATIEAGDTASAGVSTNVLREDAQFAVATGTASTITGSNATGSSSNIARADHDHALGTGVVGTSQLAASVRLDTINAPTASVALNAQKITGLADGVSGTDAVTLNQLQAAQAGLDVKASVRVATTTTGTLATSFENGDTIDGVTLATGNRILVKDQAAPAENGIYTVNASGAPTRATDFDAWTEVVGAFVTVEEGTANADTVWLSTANAGGTLNTTALTFVQWEIAAIGAGAGLTKTGTTIDVVATDTSLTVNANDVGVNVNSTGGLEIVSGVRVKLNGATLTSGASGLSVTTGTFQPLDATLTALAAYNTNGILVQTAADTFAGRTITGTASRLSVTNGSGVSGNPTLDIDSAYVGQTSITTLGTITTGTWTGTSIAVANGGTGATTAGGARTNLSAAGYYSTATHSTGTTWTITAATHGLRASRGLIVQTQIEADGSPYECDFAIASNGDVTITFGASQSANTIRTTIIG